MAKKKKTTKKKKAKTPKKKSGPISLFTIEELLEEVQMKLDNRINELEVDCEQAESELDIVRQSQEDVDGLIGSLC